MERNNRRTIIGLVVSDKMDKTISVEVSKSVKHPIYKKFVTRSKKVKAHDENNVANIGDKVLLMETRPLSKTKRFRLVEVLEQAK
ncbi:30S ribosomal protein S17 [Helcococcus ovis]|uniref:Small ribosomal subunit protein uS17 n=2 Tax=Helcococcus TaxID=31983 RepID=A0A4R9C5L6_9FIRM|nr:30S ribosomal protein S17 [Helcococcus ovis]TFF66223.1 30S ribosomal protein S17 [Helcococcus ovis]TFF66342.1 30S ribosomal protein S17 [Helcococcus ovis]TFF67298.1 30S ribosomal protein S17 [Helcococcus ovis]WNZ00950.1 30S ribosomal protein S17 [Helcococcus ovis]